MLRQIKPEYVHKPGKKDVVITELESLGNGEYKARIENKSWRHFLGWPGIHLEGMLMIEAFQQAVKASRKIYENDWRNGYYFTGLNMRFKKVASESEDHFIQINLKERNMVANPSETYVKVAGKVVDSKGVVKAEGEGNCVIYPLSFNGPQFAREKLMEEYITKVMPLQMIGGLTAVLYVYLTNPSVQKTVELINRALVP